MKGVKKGFYQHSLSIICLELVIGCLPLLFEEIYIFLK